MKIKTIDINAKEWFDRVNGNSYFSCQIVLNYGLKSEKTIFIPFQYGHGDFYKNFAIKEIYKYGFIPKIFDLREFSDYTIDNKIIVRYIKEKNQLKREVVKFGLSS